MQSIYFDFVEDSELGFTFCVAQDSPNELMCKKLEKLFETGKPFRLVVTDVYQLD